MIAVFDANNRAAMIPAHFYFMNSGGRVFGPYAAHELWSLVKAKRITDSVGLSTNPDGPWQPLHEFLAIGEDNRYYFLVATQQEPLGPVSVDYLRVLHLQTDDVGPNTPVSVSSRGPWKLICETDIVLDPTIDTQKTTQSSSVPGPNVTAPKPDSPLHIHARSTKLLLLTVLFVAGAGLSSFVGSGILNQKASGPERIISLAFTLLLNPITWLSIVPFYKYISSVCCPHCEKPIPDPKRGTVYKCAYCGKQFRTPN